MIWFKWIFFRKGFRIKVFYDWDLCLQQPIAKNVLLLIQSYMQFVIKLLLQGEKLKDTFYVVYILLSWNTYVFKGKTRNSFCQVTFLIYSVIYEYRACILLRITRIT